LVGYCCLDFTNKNKLFICFTCDINATNTCIFIIEFNCWKFFLKVDYG